MSFDNFPKSNLPPMFPSPRIDHFTGDPVSMRHDPTFVAQQTELGQKQAAERAREGGSVLGDSCKKHHSCSNVGYSSESYAVLEKLQKIKNFKKQIAEGMASQNPLTEKEIEKRISDFSSGKKDCSEDDENLKMEVEKELLEEILAKRKREEQSRIHEQHIQDFTREFRSLSLRKLRTKLRETEEEIINFKKKNPSFGVSREIDEHLDSTVDPKLILRRQFLNGMIGKKEARLETIFGFIGFVGFCGLVVAAIFGIKKCEKFADPGPEIFLPWVEISVTEKGIERAEYQYHYQTVDDNLREGILTLYLRDPKYVENIRGVWEFDNGQNQTHKIDLIGNYNCHENYCRFSISTLAGEGSFCPDNTSADRHTISGEINNRTGNLSLNLWKHCWCDNLKSYCARGAKKTRSRFIN